MSHQHPAWGTPPTPPTPKKKGARTAAIACGSLLALIAIVGAIGAATGSGSDDKASSKAPASSSAPELTDEQRASINAAAGLPPEPDAATAAAYIKALNAIDTDIVHSKDDKAISRGRSQCMSIKQGYDRAKLVDLTNSRFTSPTHPEGHGTATAGKILDVVHERLCPDF